MIGIDGKEKPVFHEGDHVAFEQDIIRGTGRIRGLVSESMIDFWIVEFDDPAAVAAVFPYTCCSLPHVCLKKIE